MTPALEEALRRAARCRTLLVASDYDGTLAPIVDDPDAAWPHAPALAALVALAACTGVHALIVSGRSLSTLRALSGSPAGVCLIGSHGLEAAGTPADARLERAAAEVTVELRRVAAEHAGTVVEPKPRGAAFHYRHAAAPRRAAAAARAVAARLRTRVIEGKAVVELFVGDGDKGTAVADVRRRIAADATVFFGDDVTDEDVFRVLGADDVAVKIGDGASSARFRVADPGEVGEALRYLRRQRRVLR